MLFNLTLNLTYLLKLFVIKMSCPYLFINVHFVYTLILKEFYSFYSTRLCGNNYDKNYFLPYQLVITKNDNPFCAVIWKLRGSRRYLLCSCKKVTNYRTAFLVLCRVFPFCIFHDHPIDVLS